jgi:hypothetical protein
VKCDAMDSIQIAKGNSLTTSGVRRFHAQQLCRERK